MTKDIVKDKFLAPILVTLIIGISSIKKTNDWFFLLIALLIVLIILSLANYLRKDLYIKNFSIDNELIRVEYQKNFSDNQDQKFFIISKSIESVNFSSKSFLDPFHKISIRYINNDGLYDKMVFKTNNDETFVQLIYELKKKKN